MVVKLYDMDDVGTRAEHMSDLQDIWSGGLAMLLSGTYHAPQELDDDGNCVEQVKELEIALKLLENHMTHAYSDVKYAKDINDLPIDPRDIKDNKEKP